MRNSFFYLFKKAGLGLSGSVKILLPLTILVQTRGYAYNLLDYTVAIVADDTRDGSRELLTGSC